MFDFGDEFEVADIVILRVPVFVVDSVPFGDGAIVVLPNCAVQSDIVAAEIPFVAIFVVFFAIENLVRVSVSPVRTFDKGFHSSLQ